jgi:hypothetical protein
MMKQQHPSQGNHPIETALTDLSRELENLLLQQGDLRKLIEQQLRTAQDEQVKKGLKKIQEFLQQDLSGVTIRSLYDIVTTVLWNAGRNLLNGIAKYKELIGDQGKKDIKEKAEAVKKNIEDMAKVFENNITYLKETIGGLQQRASTLSQELQSLQSSPQQQEIASVIQQAVSAIGDISNRITSIVQKLRNLENIFAPIQQEVHRLMGREEQQTARTAPSPRKGSADGTTSTPSEQDLPTQLGELEKRIVDLYRAVVALETVVNTATAAASIIPPKIEGMDTAALARKFIKIDPGNLDANIKAIGQYTGLNLPDPFSRLNPSTQEKQGNVTQLHFLKQQEVSTTDIQESIKSYLEEVKTFLLGARNQMEVNLNNILEELSKLGDKLGQISDIKIQQKAKRIYSIPTFVILDECKNKLTENMPPSLIETIAPLVGVILVAAQFWDSFLDWGSVGTAMTNLQNIAGKFTFQDPHAKTALSNILWVASKRLEQSNPALQQPPVPPATAEAVGATVLAALASEYVPLSEVQNALQTQGWRQQQEGPKRLRVITDSSVITKITNAVGTQGVIPRFEMIQDPKVGGVVRNIKRMINAFAEYMAESWAAIADQINEDIREGRLSDPEQKIQQAIDEINDAWNTLLNRMQATGWKEYSLDIGIEKKKIEGIKRELEQLIDACFELLEAWKAAEKPKKGALDIEALLFHPLGLPALKAALRTLPPSIPGGVITGGETTQTGGRGAQTGERTAQPKRGGAQRREEGATETKGEVAQTKEGTTRAEGGAPPTEGGAKKRLRYRRLSPWQSGRRGIVGSGSSPVSLHSEEGKGTTGKTLQEEIQRALNFIKERQVDGAIKAVANAIMILRDIASRKTQPQGTSPAHLREAEVYLSVALQKLREASRLGPNSDGFKANLQQANSLLQNALNALSNQTAGSTPYLGRNLLLLMKALRSTPTTAQSHRQRAKNEAILEKETI